MEQEWVLNLEPYFREVYVKSVLKTYIKINGESFSYEI
jgi:hypothetical protein